MSALSPPRQVAIVPQIKIATLGALACAVVAVLIVGTFCLLVPERPLWVELTIVASISAAIAFPLLCVIGLRDEALRETQRQLQNVFCHGPATDTLSANAFAASVVDAIDRRRVPTGESADGIMLVLRVSDFDEFVRHYGRQWADTVLQSLVLIVQSSVRYSDLVARLGSDELGIYLPGATTENARDICERIRARIDETTFMAGPENLSVTVRFGGTRVGRQDDFEALREAANRAALAEEEAGPLLFRELFS